MRHITYKQHCHNVRTDMRSLRWYWMRPVRRAAYATTLYVFGRGEGD